MTKEMTLEEALMMVGNDILNYDSALDEVADYVVNETFADVEFDEMYAAPSDIFGMGLELDDIIRLLMAAAA